MVLSVVIQIILGTLIAGAFYLLGDRFLSAVSLFGVPHLLSALVGFVAGALGIFALPVLSAKLARWFKGLMRSIFREALAEFWSRQIAQPVGRTFQSRLSRRQVRPVDEDPGLVVPTELPSSDGILLDTSVIIDGRLLDIVKTGFIPGKIIVPSFVLAELQRVADSSDDLRRARGRLGLKVLEDLKRLLGENFEVTDEADDDHVDVDRSLIALAQNRRQKLLTVDFNLNKAAKVSGVVVLNVNELANALKTLLIPGEVLKVKVIHGGKEPEQGVGYLDDGTMLVVEKGRDKIGSEIELEVTRVLQTEAGKIAFGRPI